MIKFFPYFDRWEDVKEAARNTANKEGSGKYPNDAWKKTILLAEHSPIRMIHVRWKWIQLKNWVSVHFVRHKFGIEHWVSTSRSDRTGINREELPQNHPVSHECEANAQALIFISRRRLCHQASPETQAAWKEVREEIRKEDPILASVMVPECIYRGFCPEFQSCGYVETADYQQKLAEYRSKNV